MHRHIRLLAPMQLNLRFCEDVVNARNQEIPQLALCLYRAGLRQHQLYIYSKHVAPTSGRPRPLSPLADFSHKRTLDYADPGRRFRDGMVDIF